MRILLAIFILCFSTISFANISQNDQVKSFIDQMSSKYNFNKAKLTTLFSKIDYNLKVIDLMNRPYEAKPWFKYKKIFITKKRINEGVKFWHQHRQLLDDISKKFKVDPKIIVATVGVETSYGKNKGNLSVLSTLSTLAFKYPKRSKFFTKELREYLLMAREQHFNPLSVKGSYAGAMGYGQFMPSSYRAYAVDFSKDQKSDILNNIADALASTANYYREHKWKLNAPIAVPADVEYANPDDFVSRYKARYTLNFLKSKGVTPKYGQFPQNMKASLVKLKFKDGIHYYLAFHNFYVIKRYNPSDRYAMAIMTLADEIQDRV